MQKRTVSIVAIIFIVILISISLLYLNRPGSGPFEESFDAVGSWGVGSDANAEGRIRNGVYDFLVKRDVGLFWSTAAERRGDGIYEVEATQVAGPLDNGYGMVFRFEGEADDFYVFEVSGDGYFWIGLCRNGCSDETTPLVGEGWVESTAVHQGLDSTNQLRVRAEGGNFVFAINGQEVARVSDPSIDQGDIGLMIETLGASGVRVEFDNFLVLPLP